MSKQISERREVPGDGATYASVSQTRALKASSQSALRSRLTSADMLESDEAAGIAGVSTRTINSWISKGRCIGLAQQYGGFRLPRWQFEPVIWDAIPKLAVALCVKEGWALLSFLESPHGALNGVTPRAAIEQGNIERVLQVAWHEGDS